MINSGFNDKRGKKQTFKIIIIIMCKRKQPSPSDFILCDLIRNAAYVNILWIMAFSRRFQNFSGLRALLSLICSFMIEKTISVLRTFVCLCLCLSMCDFISAYIRVLFWLYFFFYRCLGRILLLHFFSGFVCMCSFKWVGDLIQLISINLSWKQSNH